MVRVQIRAWIWRDPPQAPDSPPPLSRLPDVSYRGWRRQAPSPTAPPSLQRGTTFSNTAGFCRESSTRRSICASTATSDATAKAKFLFDFWDNARKGRGATLQQYCEPGLYSDSEVKAPLAAYRHNHKYYDTVGSLLIQHGSYQWISQEDQPHIEEGQVLLYRGIEQGAVFRCLQFEPSDLSAANREIWRRYLGVQAQMLSDSVLSFNTIHDRVKRSETEGLRHGTWLGDEMATQAGLDIESPGFARDLWQAAQQSYSLDPMIVVRKFGPHHVVLKTSLSNLRLTTFFAGESEVKIVDPSRVSLVEAVGCKVEAISPLH